jgi:hypothetical protein
VPGGGGGVCGADTPPAAVNREGRGLNHTPTLEGGMGGAEVCMVQTCLVSRCEKGMQHLRLALHKQAEVYVVQTRPQPL